MTTHAPPRARIAVSLTLAVAALTLTGCLSGTPEGPTPQNPNAPMPGQQTTTSDAPTPSSSAPESPSASASADPTSAPAPQPAGPPATGPHNDGDVNFTAALLANFEDSVKTVELAQSQTKNAKLIALASPMGMVQSKQLPILRGWLKGFGAPAAAPSPSSGADLSGLTDAAFDQAWKAKQLQMHDKTIAMAKAVIADGKNPQVVGHAKRVLSVAQRERAQIAGLK